MTMRNGLVRRASTKGTRKKSFVLVGLFCAMFLDAVGFPGLRFPISSIAAGLVILYAFNEFWRVAKFEKSKRPLWFVLLVLAIPSWLLVTSFLNEGLVARRLISIGLYAVILFVLSGPRLNMRQIGIGFALAVATGVTLGVVLLPRSNYSGRLTGPMGDPNSAGFLIVVFTALAVPAISRRRYQVGLIAVATTGVVLTVSRTSMLALAIMLLWVILCRFVKSWIAIPVVATVLFWVTSISENLGGEAFADRAGSDRLRERIVELETADVAIRPWIGQGAGTAVLDVDGKFFFFHSSYLALRAEAGWVGLGIMLILLVLVFLRLLALPMNSRNYFYEAALIGVAICAMNLGEVLLALPAAFALGLSMRHVIETRKILETPDTLTRVAAGRPRSQGFVRP